VSESDFEFTEADLPTVQEGQVLIRALFLSLDPYMRGRMSDAESYAEPVAVGDVMIGATVAEVIESADESRKRGDVVVAFSGWQTHAVVDAGETKLITSDAVPLSTYLGVLGMPGFTAYAGLLALGKPQPGQVLAVAAATGPVGSAVGQIARLKGMRTIGIAGGPKKVSALREKFGFDAALDHRDPEFARNLELAVPDGIDVYFENVGGLVADAIYPHLNKFARVPVCGLVADYNAINVAVEDRLSGLMHLVLTRSLQLRGFIQDEFVEKYHESFERDMAEWVANGSVNYLEDIVDGLDNAPSAFRGLLTGQNFGKLVIRVAEDA